MSGKVPLAVRWFSSTMLRLVTSRRDKRRTRRTSSSTSLKIDEWNRMVDVNIKGVLYGSEQAHLGRPSAYPLLTRPRMTFLGSR